MEELIPIKETDPVQFYTIGKKLGSGAFSVVYDATNKTTELAYAIKVIDKKAISELNKTLHIKTEVAILRKLSHPNIVQIYEIYETEKHLYLVMEKMNGGELYEQIIERKKYGEKHAARILKQIIVAIIYLHSKEVVHRDLKPENILLSSKEEKNPTIKISDFGLSKVMSNQVLKTKCGTPGYVAPEVLAGNGYDSSVDIWSVGVIFYILLCGFPPFYAENNVKLYQKILNGKFYFPSPYWDSVSEEAKDLINKMLVIEKEDRIKEQDILNHPFFDKSQNAHNDLSSNLVELKKTNENEKKSLSEIHSSSSSNSDVSEYSFREN